ncbi:hypothetical protein GCM10011614_34870 [Novosphingobium colocasiae]|uniref:Uncharacterized protein n=1 Tax=Novosphingobium colocasiae TaxID=1256513 RepID=A0A918PNK1_9SPHN|nr:hypothetical protein GCM10011614_34870 [Novosphingobium colocasiae]
MSPNDLIFGKDLTLIEALKIESEVHPESRAAPSPSGRACAQSLAPEKKRLLLTA